MKNGNLQKWALVAEIVSAVVVVVSIVFLIFEVRSNTEAMQAQGLQSIAERTQQISLSVALDPELAEISSLFWGVSAEQNRINSYLVSVMKIGEESFIQYHNGNLDEDVWQSRASYVLMHMQNEAARRIFEAITSSGNWVPKYVEWLTQEIDIRYGNK